MCSGAPRMPRFWSNLWIGCFCCFPMMVNSPSVQNHCHYLHSSPSYLHSLRMFLQTSPLNRRLLPSSSSFHHHPLLFSSPFSSCTVFDGSKSPHRSFTNAHFLSPHTHTQKHKINPLIVSCPPELLSDYVKQKSVRTRAGLNRWLISMCLLIGLLSVSHHWGQRWSPTDSNTSSTPDRPQSQCG